MYAKSETISPSPLIEKSDTEIFSLPYPFVLSRSLPISNGLFFIRHTPEYTFKQQLFLVKVNYEETAILNMQPITKGDYHVTFLA